MTSVHFSLHEGGNSKKMSYKELFLYIVQIKKLVQSTAPVRTNRFCGNPSQITDRS